MKERLLKGFLGIYLIAGATVGAEVKSFSDSSLLRLSKTVYFKSSLGKWRALIEVARHCPVKGQGPLLLLEAISFDKVAKALELLQAPELSTSKIPEEALLEDLFFLLRLELYAATRAGQMKLQFSSNCVQKRVQKNYRGELLAAEAQEEVLMRLGQFEMILRDRIGIEANDKLRLPLRKRQLELIESLQETLKSQYSYEWLLAP